MQLDSLEAVVRRLVTDAEFRSRAIAKPSEAISEYRLTGSERTAVLNLIAIIPFGLGVQIGIQGTWF